MAAAPVPGSESPAGTPTIASVLKAAGRATAIVGKWHLGLGEPGQDPDWNGVLAPEPPDLGFDHCFILPTTNDRVPPVFVAGRRVKGLDPAGERARFRDEDLADAWVRESVRWIDDHKNAPSFLFLASHDLHVPHVAPERFQGRSPLGPRGDCILSFDWCVGEVTAALERLGLAADTLVIVCSDNGSGRLGYRAGRWKPVRVPPRKGPGPPRGYGADGVPPGDALYDLDADPGETTDVAARHAGVAARLGADLDRIVGAAAATGRESRTR